MKDYLAMLKRSPLRFAGRGALLLLALFCALPSALPQTKPRTNTFKGFTLIRQVTDYDKADRALPTSTETLYVSQTGDWRWLRTYPNGQVVETIYLCNKGIFFADHKHGQLVKFANAGGRPGPTTDERLQLNPKFVRMEYVLGTLAYLHRQDINDYVEETYYTPELGPFPFKRINYFDDFKNVEEPVSLTFAEPEASELREDYPLVLQQPIYDAKLSARITQKPSPEYPAQARAAGISGNVPLEVIVDESGQVIRAAPVGALPLLNEAAIEAAYRARFSPAERAGKAVKTRGVITYTFSLQR